MELQLGVFEVGKKYSPEEIRAFLYRVQPEAHFTKAWHAQSLKGAIYLGAFGDLLRQLNDAYGDSIRAMVPLKTDFDYLHLYFFNNHQSMIFRVTNGQYEYLGSYAAPRDNLMDQKDVEGEPLKLVGHPNPKI